MRIITCIALALLVLAPFSAMAQEQPPAKVVVSNVSEKEVAQNQAMIGTLYYDRVSRLSSELAGLVAAVHVREGDRVDRHAVLVDLNTDILDTEIKLTETRIAQIALRIENAEKNLKRLERLHAQEGVSEKDYEDALYAYQDLVKEKQAHQDILTKLHIQKKRSRIRAPFTGVILSKDVDVGAWVNPGKEIVGIASSQDLFVKVPVGESMLRHINIGAEVPVLINAYDRQLTGIIQAVAPVADAQTKNVFLKINIADQHDVAVNMSATVHVATSPTRKLAIIPRDALVRNQGQTFIYTIKEGKAAILPVNIVAFLGEEVGVDNTHIVPGMPVVIEGNERLRPDQAVEVSGEH